MWQTDINFLTMTSETAVMNTHIRWERPLNTIGKTEEESGRHTNETVKQSEARSTVRLTAHKEKINRKDV